MERSERKLLIVKIIFATFIGMILSSLFHMTNIKNLFEGFQNLLIKYSKYSLYFTMFASLTLSYFLGLKADRTLSPDESIKHLYLEEKILQVSILLCIFFLVGALSGIIYCENNNFSYKLREYILLLLSWLIYSILLICLISRLYEKLKSLSLNRKGNVFSFRFDKDWLNSADEYEKLLIYEKSYKAHKRMTVCATLLLIIYAGLAINQTLPLFPIIFILLPLLMGI